jgi:hypothetical protein
MEMKTAMEMKGRDGIRTEGREEKKLVDSLVGSIHISTPQAARPPNRGSSHRDARPQGRKATRHQTDKA